LLHPLPRLHFDRHLFNPLLKDGGKEWRKHVSVTPPAIVESESRLIDDVKRFWRKNLKKNWRRIVKYNPQYRRNRKNSRAFI